MVTTKLPFPGFSLLTSTRARSPTALAILLARLLNAPHCLQASTVTTFFDDEAVFETAFGFASVTADILLALVAAAFLGGDFLAAAFFGLTGRSSSGAAALAALLESLVDRRVGAILKECFEKKEYLIFPLVNNEFDCP